MKQFIFYSFVNYFGDISYSIAAESKKPLKIKQVLFTGNMIDCLAEQTKFSKTSKTSKNVS